MKTTAALKRHSEAERRRRERINAHLQILRDLVCTKEKMDKATLLGEVVSQLKELKTAAKHATEGLNIPIDTDDVNIEMINGLFYIRASICCDYGPELLSGIKEALIDLPFRLSECKISTLGDRVKIVLIMSKGEKKEDTELLVTSLRAALCDIIKKASALAEYPRQLHFPLKRQRVLYD
ncbi:basic helix-loop-helix (bHLH) DNA-bindingsuperfamily protein [Striga asiatica]|uniref:Basic helix-loop-helix (BHLH) DNA-bindingsuperfamily protein n=1 Tax=Striga asiatica TaxID=4170 RepID=A0A5A7RKD4_STRAF|nr:basic helix-loop-helix (bHLH) DNA-bindingsuperfamily protein [Striga asiatica]